MLSVHVHEKGGARGPREHEETVLAARRYDGYQCIYDVAAAANIVKHELDGSRCEIRAFLTKIDVWNPAAIPRSLDEDGLLSRNPTSAQLHASVTGVYA